MRNFWKERDDRFFGVMIRKCAGNPSWFIEHEVGVIFSWGDDFALVFDLIFLWVDLGSENGARRPVHENLTSHDEFLGFSSRTYAAI